MVCFFLQMIHNWESPSIPTERGHDLFNKGHSFDLFGGWGPTCFHCFACCLNPGLAHGLESSYGVIRIYPTKAEDFHWTSGTSCVSDRPWEAFESIVLKVSSFPDHQLNRMNSLPENAYSTGHITPRENHIIDILDLIGRCGSSGFSWTRSMCDTCSVSYEFGWPAFNCSIR